MFMCMRHCVNEKSIVITHFSYLNANQLKIRRPGTNRWSKKNGQDSCLGEMSFLMHQLQHDDKNKTIGVEVQNFEVEDTKNEAFLYVFYIKN